MGMFRVRWLSSGGPSVGSKDGASFVEHDPGGSPSRVRGALDINITLSITFGREASSGACSTLRLCSHDRGFGARRKDRYLVDPASSHMLVSKIKPCMSKYKRYTVKLRMAH